MFIRILPRYLLLCEEHSLPGFENNARTEYCFRLSLVCLRHAGLDASSEGVGDTEQAFLHDICEGGSLAQGVNDTLARVLARLAPPVEVRS